MSRLSLVPWWLDPREASTLALKQLRRAPPARVMAELDAIVARHPRSPHPSCYRGELKLWLGDYAAALADFERALSIRPARWAYIGTGAALLLLGQREAALAAIAEGRARFQPIPGATTHVYLGELARREGRLDDARAHLERGLRVKPGRWAAWINLALVHHARGDADAAASVHRALRAAVPGLLWSAAASLHASKDILNEGAIAAPVLERALEQMRGNRSSHTITYFPDDGVMRVAPPPGVWSDIAWESIEAALESLLRGLGDG